MISEGGEERTELYLTTKGGHMMPPGLTSMVPLPGPLLLLKSLRYGLDRTAHQQLAFSVLKVLGNDWSPPGYCKVVRGRQMPSPYRPFVCLASS